MPPVFGKVVNHHLVPKANQPLFEQKKRWNELKVLSGMLSRVSSLNLTTPSEAWILRDFDFGLLDFSNQKRQSYKIGNQNKCF